MATGVKDRHFKVLCKQCVNAGRVNGPTTLALVVQDHEGQPVPLVNRGRKSSRLRGTLPATPGSRKNVVLVVPEAPAGYVPAGIDSDRWRAISAGPSATREKWEPLSKGEELKCSAGHVHRIGPAGILKLWRKDDGSGEAAI